jgi:predicted RNase H-like HicB family nuclease
MHNLDLPGCVATGFNRDNTEQLIAEAIKFHLEGLAEEGMAIPLPSSEAEMMVFAA